MRPHVNLTIDERLKRDFMDVHRGSLSSFLEDKMAEYLEKMRQQYWLVCWSCKQKSHIRVVLNNNGSCPKDGCGVIIAEKIENTG